MKKLLLIGCLIILTFIANIISENESKKNRGEVLASIESALDEGDYQEAFYLAEPHKTRKDADLRQLVNKAAKLKREADERARQEQIERLISEIKAAQGDEREAKLERLLSLAPDTKEFPDEFAKIRDAAQAERQKNTDAAIAELKKQLCIYLEQLLGFKDDPKFKQYGFAPGGAYNQWLKAVEESMESQRADTSHIPIELRAAPFSLYSLGKKYIYMEESEGLRLWLSELKGTLGYGSYLANKP